MHLGEHDSQPQQRGRGATEPEHGAGVFLGIYHLEEDALGMVWILVGLINLADLPCAQMALSFGFREFAVSVPALAARDQVSFGHSPTIWELNLEASRSGPIATTSFL